MTTVKDLQKQFHCCMPLFIALGDKVRLSIVELLSEDALKNGGTRGTIDFEGCAMNVNEITRLTLRDSTRSLMELGYRLEEFM